MTEGKKKDEKNEKKKKILKKFEMLRKNCHVLQHKTLNLKTL